MRRVWFLQCMLVAVSTQAGLLFTTVSTTQAATFTEVDGKVVMEAEDFTSRTSGVDTNGVEKNWYGSTNYDGYSGLRYMQAVPNHNTPCTGAAPCLNYDVTFNTPGEYVVMVRLYGPTSSDNSVLIGVDGSVLTTGGLGVECGAAWSWRYMAGVSSAFTVSSPGTKTINVWMREDGVCVDKIMIIKNIPDELLSPYDPDIAMWRSSLDSHLTRSTGRFLLAAGLMGELDNVRVEDALSTLKSCQTNRFKWTYEESSPGDYNADFFVLLDLIPFYLQFSNELSTASTELVDDIFDTANGYMTTRIANYDESRYRYPNATIGDLVVTYLLNEINGSVLTNTTAQLRAAFDYYKENEWGWGEHLSDTYAKVIQDELSLLLFCSSALPTDIAEDAKDLLHELIAIDKRFPNGVRVPAIRSYALTTSPKTPTSMAYSSQPFSDTITPAPSGADYLQQYALRELWYEYGWLTNEDLDVASVVPAASQILCYDGVNALNNSYGNFRIGVLTEYPLMEDIDFKEWGLMWQSMPAAFWHEEGDWGFLQWEVQEGTNALALPSNNRYTQPSHVLTTGTSNSPLPITRGVAIEGGYLAVRTLPSTLSSWSTVEDRVRILDGAASVSEPTGSNDWECLTLNWGTNDQLFVDYLPLQNGGSPAIESSGNRYDWGFKYDMPISEMASIWMLRADNSAGLPVQYTKQDAWILVWDDGTHLSVQPYIIGASQNASRIFQVANDQVCMEAENGRFAGRMDHKSWWLFREMDGGGYYITIDPSAPAAVVGGDDFGTASYYFNLTTSQEYSFLARLNAPGPNDDSFFYRIDSGEWVTCNNYSTGTDWKWKKYGANFSLGAGLHRLTIYYREDGANLDRFLIQKSSLTDLTDSTETGPVESLWQNN